MSYPTWLQGLHDRSADLDRAAADMGLSRQEVLELAIFHATVMMAQGFMTIGQALSENAKEVAPIIRHQLREIEEQEDQPWRGEG